MLSILNLYVSNVKFRSGYAETLASYNMEKVLENDNDDRESPPPQRIHYVRRGSSF